MIVRFAQSLLADNVENTRYVKDRYWRLRLNSH
jgi:hypothetical protein